MSNSENKTNPSEFCLPPNPAMPESKMDSIRVTEPQNKMELDSHNWQEDLHIVCVLGNLFSKAESVPAMVLWLLPKQTIAGK